MKKSWIVAGLTIGAVVAVGVIMLTTKNANDTKSEIDSTTGSVENAETAKQTEMDSSVNFVPSSAAGGEKNGWLVTLKKIYQLRCWRCLGSMGSCTTTIP